MVVVQWALKLFPLWGPIVASQQWIEATQQNSGEGRSWGKQSTAITGSSLVSLPAMPLWAHLLQLLYKAY